MKRIFAALALLLLCAPALGQTQGDPFAPYSSPSAENSKVIQASASQLKSIYVTSTQASLTYLMVFNSTTVPADGAVTPVHCLPVQATSFISLNNDIGGAERFATGLSVALSTTGCFTKTSPGSNVGFFRVRYQ